jgi:hypothetical protein
MTSASTGVLGGVLPNRLFHLKRILAIIPLSSWLSK